MKHKCKQHSIPIQNTVSMIKTQARLEGRALCNVRGEGSFDLPPDVLFNLLADPNNHLHIFDAIEVS